MTYLLCGIVKDPVVVDTQCLKLWEGQSGEIT